MYQISQRQRNELKKQMDESNKLLWIEEQIEITRKATDKSEEEKMAIIQGLTLYKQEINNL